METGYVVLIAIAVVLALALFIWRESVWQQRQRWWEEEAGKRIEEAVQRSRAVLGGRFSEQLAPYLPGFRYDPTEARFIGNPVDLIVFPGLAARAPEKVVFIEVKTGKSQLSAVQRRIKELVERGEVAWEELRLAGASEG